VAHQDHPVGEEERLLHVMGDEENGGIVTLPERRYEDLRRLARERVQ
jgi:hypothetical protein